MRKNKIIGHLLALITVVIWGITFITTKVLLNDFSPEEILVYRFAIALIILLIINPQKIKILKIREEFLFAILGLTGITMYFWIENLALKYTYASNVGLISSAIPIFTVFLAQFITKEEKFTIKFIIGFITAITGIFIIMYNGRDLKLNPIGDILALITAILFAIYSILLKKVNNEYNQLFITKRIFFYGVVFIIPIASFNHISVLNIRVLNFNVIASMLFLSVFASVLCFLMWNKSVNIIGSIKATNYIYFVPLVTMLSAFIFLNEKINVLMIIGGVLIFLGVYINNLKNNNKIDIKSCISNSKIE